MYKFIQRKKKLLLALFGVVLMIAFIVPAGVNQMADTTGTVVGRAGDDKITQGDIQQAHRDLDALLYAQFPPLMQLGETMFGRGTANVAQKLRDHPETYVLLQREAKAAGVVVDNESVDTLFALFFRQRATTPDQVAGYRAAIERFLLVRNNFQRVLADIKVTQPLVRESIVGRQEPTLNLVEFKAADFLADAKNPSDTRVIAHYNQYAATIPAPPSPFGTTQPVQFGYRQLDKLKLQYLELPAQQLFDAAIKNLSGVDLLPLQRVAFAHYTANPTQYQSAPATQPATTPATTTAPATTQPATAATAPAATATAATAPSTAPTTRPFADVRADIQRKILLGEITPTAAPAEDLAAAQALRQRIEARAAELRNALRDRLAKDYKAARDQAGTKPAAKTDAGKPDAATKPADAPATAGLGKLEAVDYLESVANDFEKAHGVRPVVKSLASDWLTTKELAALPGIGAASADAESFPQLATKHAADIQPAGPERPKTNPATNPAATQPASTQDTATQPATAAATQDAATQPSAPITVEATPPAKPALALYEPSPVLVDVGENAYIFRLTAFNGAHVPTLDEARPAIVNDLKLVEAYDLARQKAAAVRDAAASAAAPVGQSKIGGLPVVNPPVIEVGPIAMNSQQPEFPGYDVSDPGVLQRLAMATSSLLRNAKADQPHPATLVEVPAQQKVLVIELRSYVRPWTSEEDARMLMNSITTARTALMRDPTIEEALLNWFDKDAVAQRMNYKQEK